jgi:formylglycine-generating enzyme
MVQTCDNTGQWPVGGTACSAETEICVAGACVTPPSCAGLPSTCGPAGDESCCGITAVPGGKYKRSYDGVDYTDDTYPATVSNFRLDRFEITVGRFRNFVKAYPGNTPMKDAGAHPLIPGSGWDTSWNAILAQNYTKELKCSLSYNTWTDGAGPNENLPINCINWYDAFAFCAWDGGRLPTEAEWNYAAAGGEEQRHYPWGSMAPSSTYAVYDCTEDGSAAGNCALSDIAKVGSKSPAGDGSWGQADLAGSVWEWNLDWYAPSYSNPCINCAQLQPAAKRVARSGGWYLEWWYLRSGARGSHDPANRSYGLGARCARTP